LPPLGSANGKEARRIADAKIKKIGEVKRRRRRRRRIIRRIIRRIRKLKQ
jgi:hypothetical protein